MFTSWVSLNFAEKLLGAVAVAVTTFMLAQLPGPIKMDTQISFYENGQWQAARVIEISPNVQQAVNGGDESVMQLVEQINKLKGAAAGTEVKFTYNEQVRSDGWTVITASGTGTGYDSLSNILFSGKADFRVGVFDTDKREVSLFVGNLDPQSVTAVGGKITYRITGQQITQSNADQVQLLNTAIWDNPTEMDVKLTEIAGAPPGVTVAELAPEPGGEQPQVQPAQQPNEVNVIRNGDFELSWVNQDGVAPEWEGYDNGRAHASWYEELWPEAVRRGERAQLMEIFEVEANVLDRVIAIYQTVDVVPNAQYALELYAIMRTDADPALRNQSEFEMHWGIDPFGEGNYDNVQTWHLMPLTEQNRRGSTAPYPEDIPLVYERITGTVTTTNTNQITLFIRGLKKFPTNVEVNFDVDEVSLVGPAPGTIMAASKPDAAAPTEQDAKLPTSGAVLSRPASVGMMLLGGLVLVILGTAAAASLLHSHRRDL